MADKVYTIRLNGHDVEIQAPENASPADLRAAAEKVVPPLPGAPAPVSLNAPPQVPFPEEFGPRPTDISPADPWAKSATAAFREGFAEPRREDPFGLNTENRSFTPLDIPLNAGRTLLELGESLYGGVKKGTGQLLYNLGVSKSSPSVIAQSAFELPEWWLMQSGTNPAGLAPRVVSGLNAVNQARVAAGLPAPARIALSPERQRQLELYNLGQTYGVDLLPADVSGNTIRGGVLRGSTAGGAQTILGGPQIRSAAARANAQMGDVARQTAQAQGQVLPAVEAGEALQRGARTYVDTTSARADRLYKQAERAAGDLRIPAENAVNAVDTAIMQAMEGGKAATDPAIVALQNIRDRLTRFDDVGGLSFNGIRQVISDLGAEAFGSDMVANNLSRVLKNIRANAKQDLTAAVRRTGSRSAINKLNRANAFWENRVETINDVLEPILGAGKSGEDIVAAVQSMSRGTKGGSRRLSGLLAAMPADAANNARATIIDRLGMAAPSAQGAEGGVFSSATFLTNWNKMTPEGRNALIGNNPAVRQRLNDLARLAEARQGTERLSNVSGTGRAVNFATQLGQAAALVGGSFYDMGTALTLAALDAGAGRLLSSPEFARIVAGAPKSGQAAMSAAARARVMKQLGALAARQPGFQPYINKIADSLSNPTPPPFDYTKVGEPAPEMPDFSNLSADDLATLRASMVPKDAVEDADVALPPEPSMNVTAPVE